MSVLRIAVTTAALVATCALPATAEAATTARHFANCTAMHKVYPHGVGKKYAHDRVRSGKPVTNFKRSNALYAANARSDRDHDGVACEKH